MPKIVSILSFATKKESFSVKPTQLVPRIPRVGLPGVYVAVETFILRAFVFNHVQRFGLHEVHVLHLQNALGHFHRRVHINVSEDSFGFLDLENMYIVQESLGPFEG
jgi:hypothetical protein